ncbi:unnamed protein product [Rotaria sordida]|nr:unnamed protein product [Rotaria sordida]
MNDDNEKPLPGTLIDPNTCDHHHHTSHHNRHPLSHFVPTLVELHIHLDGSFRHSTLFELAEKKDIPLPSGMKRTIEDFIPYVCVQSDCKSLADFLGKFPFFISIVAGDADALERVAYESMEIVELAHKYRSAGVVGIDLAAGDEYEHSVAPHVTAFQRATELGIHRTVHAGESGSADSVRQAIEQCHAERIGHGYAIIDDPSVYELIHSRDIHLECCLTSSLQTNAVGKYAPKDCDIQEKHLMLNGQETNTKLHLHMKSKKEVWHPLHHFARDHLNFSLSCDDPSVSQITIEHEYKHALVDLKLSPAQLTQCVFNAARSSFLPEKEKDELMNRLLVNYIPKDVLKRYTIDKKLDVSLLFDA